MSKKKKDETLKGIDKLAAELSKLDDEVDELGEENNPIKKFKDKKEMLETLMSRFSSLEKRFREHINEPTATIMVKEKDGSWGDWTGTFELNQEEKLELVLKNVEDHFESNFRRANKDKTFAIFKTVNGERDLHKILKS